MNTRTVCLAGFGAAVLLAGLMAARPAAPGPTAPAAARPAAPRRASLLSATATQQFWRRHQLNTLLQLDRRNGQGAQSGFFGNDGFRLDVALLQVQRDASNPHVYRVEGKSRCLKKIAVPFQGVIVFSKVYQAPAQAGEPPRYTLVGSFEFEEERIARNTGTYRGTLTTDVQMEDGRLQYSYVEGSPANRCGARYKGQWRSTEGEVETVVWAQNWRALANQVFLDFEVGERMPSINRKYANRGWNQFWENDEWWADSPAATTRISL